MPLKFRLKLLLAMREMTQKQLAEVTGIRPPTISAICTNSVKQLPVGVIEKICKALNCQPGDMMEYTAPATDKEDTDEETKNLP